MNNPVLLKKTAELKATGLSQQAIAKEIGVSQPTIHRALKREELKELVETEHAKFLQSLPNARANIQNLIDTYNDIKDDKERERAWRSSMEMLRSAGLLPSHSMSVLLQQISMTQNISLSPQLLHRIIRLQDDGENGETVDIPSAHATDFSIATESEIIGDSS